MYIVYCIIGLPSLISFVARWGATTGTTLPCRYKHNNSSILKPSNLEKFQKQRRRSNILPEQTF